MDRKKAAQVFPYRLLAGLCMILLIVAWALGWLTAPRNLFAETDSPLLLMTLTTIVLCAWNLLGCTVAAGFFHAASRHPAQSYREYRNASLRLMATGMIFLFPVPAMTYVLGSAPQGRALALVVTAMSIAAVILSRARLRMIQRRLDELSGADDLVPVAPLQEF